MNQKAEPSVMRLYKSCVERRKYYASKNMEVEVALMDKALLEIEQEFETERPKGQYIEATWDRVEIGFSSAIIPDIVITGRKAALLFLGALSGVGFAFGGILVVIWQIVALVLGL